MPIPITELQPGDRVILHCPRSILRERIAGFLGIHTSPEEMLKDSNENVNLAGMVMTQVTNEFLTKHSRWATFELGVQGFECLLASFAIDADGNLIDDDGRTIFVERKLGRPAVG